LLLVLALQAALLAIALLRQRENLLSNHYLAALLIVLAGMLTPFIIGYAGFYDAYPWLSFAPLALPLAVGPLLYAHIHALVLGRRAARIHFLLPALHFAYLAICFMLPLTTKNRIDAVFQTPILDPIMSAAVLASMAGYGAAGFRMVGRYARSARGRSGAERRAAWLKRSLAAFFLLLAARGGVELWDNFIGRLDYFDLFGFYVVLAVIGVFLGIEGWRHASTPFPPLPVAPNLTTEAEAWTARLAKAGWWRDPDLTLAELARRLGTNESYLSRALNRNGEGGFSALLNRLRAEEVARRLAAGDPEDLLGIALDSGFGSKASFNRAFRSRYGIPPSAYRERYGSTTEFSAPSAI
jgi:AraC-like DNA-binding protein